MEAETHNEPIVPPITLISPSIMNKEVVNRTVTHPELFSKYTYNELKGTLKTISVRSASQLI